MKNNFILFFLVLTASQMLGQADTFIGATVVNTETQEPIPHVNVGFFNKAIGTVTNELGQFRLIYNSKDVRKASLQISAIGFESIEIPFEEIKNLTSYKVLLPLIPKEYGLDEVYFSAGKRELEKLGSSVYHKKNLGYWRNIEGLGGELATFIRINHKNTLLHNLTFNIEENLSDSLQVRVNIYDYHRGLPGENLVRKNIYHTISKKKGEETIPLKEYNITVDKNIIVSLELIEVYGDAIYFAVSASPYSGDSYTKKISQDSWLHYPDMRLGFNLISSYSKGNTRELSVKRALPNNVHIYWDTSYAMKDRDFDEESKLIKRYLRKCNNLGVKVSKFNTDIYETKMFNVQNGNSSEVIDYLEDSFYQGTSSYKNVLQKNGFKADATMLFTNGVSKMTVLSPSIDSRIFTVNSKEKANHETLQDIARYNEGHYLDLTRLKAKETINYLISDVKDVGDYSNPSKNDRENVYGVVYSDDGPVQGAYVVVNSGFNAVETDIKGAYSISANPGDILTVDAAGMLSKDTIVSSLKKMNIPLILNGEKLDEVELKRKGNTKEYAKELVETPFGLKKRGSLGYSIFNKFTSKDIKPADLDLNMILARMHGVRIGPRGVYFVKTNGNSFLDGGVTLPVIVVDDMLFDQMSGQHPPPINTERIKSITLLKTSLSTVQYGQLAAYGAIVVEMKDPGEPNGEITQQPIARDITIKGNDYTENVPLLENAMSIFKRPSYISEIEKANTYEEALIIYRKLLETNEARTVSFFMEMGDYFEKWNTSFSTAVYATIIDLAPTNLKALKSVGYKFQEKEKWEEALALYEYMVNTFPSKAQSYLDVAMAYKNTGAYKTAASLYTQMLYNQIPNVDFSSSQSIISNELRDLVANHKSQIDFENLPAEFLELNYKKDYRLVFEWNDPLVEFKIQFVNPEGKYYEFLHTYFENGSAIDEEIKHGITSTEFEIDDASIGKWIINFESSEIKNDKNPVYLKYTLYKDFGLSSQSQSTRVIDMSDLNQKVTLENIMINLQN